MTDTHAEKQEAGAKAQTAIEYHMIGSQHVSELKLKSLRLLIHDVINTPDTRSFIRETHSGQEEARSRRLCC